MYQHLTDWETHAENMQISVCFCKTCICLKNLENIQISVNMINRLDITDEYSVKCDFILNTVTFIDAALNISLRKLWKCNVLWFYLFGQGVPNETKGTINLKMLNSVLDMRNKLNRYIETWPAKETPTFVRICISVRMCRPKPHGCLAEDSDLRHSSYI